jgi:hemerythrin
MAFIDWTANYSVKVDAMDEQHKKLIALINELHEAMKTGQGKEVTSRVLTNLVRYTQTHFTAEEKLLEQYHYPKLGEQKIAHKGFVAKIQETQKKAETTTIGVNNDLLKFLKDWLINHIEGSDKQYGEHIMAQTGSKQKARV